LVGGRSERANPRVLRRPRAFWMHRVPVHDLSGYRRAHDSNADKDRLCPPTAYPRKSIDWISVF
jgi:hypothetical protein